MRLEEDDVQRIEELLDEYGKTLTVDEVAEILKVSKETVWSLLNSAKQSKDPERKADPLPGYKTGKTWFIVRDELKDWLLRRRNSEQ